VDNVLIPWGRDHDAPEPEVDDRNGRNAPAAATRTTHAPPIIGPGAAPQDPEITTRRSRRIPSRRLCIIVLPIPIRHPLPDVPR